MKLKLFTSLLSKIQENIDNGTIEAGALIVATENAGDSEGQLVFIDQSKQQVKLGGEPGATGSGILYDVVSED